VLTVVAPSVIGMTLRALIGDRRLARAMKALKMLNLIDLLILSYSNAALALPQVVEGRDWDFIALSLAITATMCVGAFAAGWLFAHSLRAESADRIAVTYGVGMNNNGTGLVLASTALPDHPLVLPPSSSIPSYSNSLRAPRTDSTGGNQRREHRCFLVTASRCSLPSACRGIHACGLMGLPASWSASKVSWVGAASFLHHRHLSILY
jgi:hypothetical protein